MRSDYRADAQMADGLLGDAELPHSMDELTADCVSHIRNIQMEGP
jgi:hypothetical protein